MPIKTSFAGGFRFISKWAMLQYIFIKKEGADRMGQSGITNLTNTMQLLITRNDWLKTSLMVREVWGLITGPVKSDAVSPTARHRSDVSSEL